MGGTVKLTSYPEFDKFEIMKTNTTSIQVVSDTSATVVIPHNLGFVPIPLVFLDSGDSVSPFKGAISHSFGSGSIAISILGNYTVDETDLYLFLYTATSVTTQNYGVRYYLLRERSS